MARDRYFPASDRRRLRGYEFEECVPWERLIAGMERDDDGE